MVDCTLGRRGCGLGGERSVLVNEVEMMDGIGCHVGCATHDDWDTRELLTGTDTADEVTFDVRHGDIAVSRRDHGSCNGADGQSEHGEDLGDDHGVGPRVVELVGVCAVSVDDLKEEGKRSKWEHEKRWKRRYLQVVP